MRNGFTKSKRKGTRVDPVKADPSLTGGIRRAFEAGLRLRIARVVSQVWKEIDGDDSLGLKATLNVFCPTGEGGGIDPTCKPGGKAGIKERRIADLHTAADAVGHTSKVTIGSGGDILHPNTWGKDGHYDGHSLGFTTTAGSDYVVSIAKTVPLKAGLPAHELVFQDMHGDTDITGAGGAVEVFRKVSAATLSYVKTYEPAALMFTAAEESRVKLYDRLTSTLGVAMPEYVALAAQKDKDGGKRYLLVKKGLETYAHDYIRQFSPRTATIEKLTGNATPDDDDWVFVDLPVFDPDWFDDEMAANVFCPTGEGGGVDPSCQPKGIKTGTLPGRPDVTFSIKENRRGMRNEIDTVIVALYKKGANGYASGEHGLAAKAYTPTGHDESDMIGFAGLRPNKDGTYFVAQVHVDETHRRQGLASAMYDAVLGGGITLSKSPIQTDAGDKFRSTYAARRGMTANVFCPTGEGGGIDPTCGNLAGRKIGYDPKVERSWSDRGTFKSMVREEGVADGVHIVEPFVYTVKGKEITLHKDLDAVYDREDNSFTLVKRVMPPEKIEDRTYTHGTSKIIQSVTDLKPGTSYGNWGANEYDAIYVAQKGHESTGADGDGRSIWGQYSHEVQLTPGTKIAKTPAEVRDAMAKHPDKSPQEALKSEGYHGVAKLDERGDVWEMAVFENRFKAVTTNIRRVTTNAEKNWKFGTSAQKVEEFRKWLGVLFDQELTGPDDESLWTKFVTQAFRKGVARSFDDFVKTQAGSKAEKDVRRGEFLRSAFRQPVAIEKVKLLAARTFSDLKGVTDATGTMMTRVLADGLARGDSPRLVALKLREVMDTTTLQRALTIARTETIRAHAEGQLVALKELGVKSLGVQVEWSTTGDAKVCSLCKPLQGLVVPIDKASGMLPRHPNCRCAWKPHVELPDGFKRVNGRIVANRLPMIRLGNLFNSVWDIVVTNAFCATGKGGGIDPTCGKGGGTKLGALMSKPHKTRTEAEHAEIRDLASGMGKKELVELLKSGGNQTASNSWKKEWLLDNLRHTTVVKSSTDDSPPKETSPKLKPKQSADKTLRTSVTAKLHVTDNDHPAVVESLETLGKFPKRVHDVVAAYGIEVYIGRRPIHEQVDLGGRADEQLRGWPPGSTLRNSRVGGVFIGKKVIVTDAGQHMPTLAAHEYVHAFDRAMNLTFTNKELKAFHIELHSKLSAYEQQGGPGNSSGISEMLAVSVSERLVNGRAHAVAKYNEKYIDWVDSTFGLEGK